MSKRFGSLLKMVREEGVVGTLRFGASRLVRIASTGSIYPQNTIQANRDLWERYDWSEKGEEWTVKDAGWKESLVSQVLAPNISLGSRVLEIGPGGGRWTEYLVPRASHLTLVDLTPECIRLCKQRFARHSHIDYFVNDGRDLSFVKPGSIDRIWSFDVFVHIAPADIGRYLDQFRLMLAPGGRAVIHHARLGRHKEGWRSDMTAPKMREMCRERGFEVLDQFDRWPGGALEFDVVTIFG